jgi:hypothetical protein
MKKEIMKKVLSLLAILLIVILALLTSNCTDESGAKKTLETNGYRPINVGGYGWVSGSKDDLYITKFIAIAPNGDTVKGCVTRGLMSGSIIRLEN